MKTIEKIKFGALVFILVIAFPILFIAGINQPTTKPVKHQQQLEQVQFQKSGEPLTTASINHDLLVFEGTASICLIKQ